jgi:hypothetical protein
VYLPRHPAVAYLVLVRRMSRTLILLAFVTCSATAADPRPIDVPFSELVKHPRKYSGKRVAVRAYVVTSCTHCGEFWESVKAARDSRVHDSAVQQCIAIGGYRRGYILPKWFARRLDSQDYDGYVRVIGRFEYRPLTQRVIPQPKSKVPLPPGVVERDIIRTTLGFGWMGLDDKQITDIRELIPLGAPIPAHIN